MFNLPSPLDKVFADKSDLPKLFDNLAYSLVKLLNCDRCYFYLRDPELLVYQIPHCYCSDSDIPNLTQTKSSTESYYRAQSDPLFAAALKGEPNIYINNIKELIAKEEEGNFWQKNYEKQKALIQAHIFIENQLWGIIQASQYKKMRPWTEFDRNVMTLVVDKITPLTTVYIKKKLRGTLQEFNDGNM